MKNKMIQKGVVKRLLKTIWAFYPVMLPITLVCIVFSAIVTSIPTIFMQNVIAIIEDNWQTGSSEKVCRLAFNLWNGYTDIECPKNSTPANLFCCSYMPYFQEGIKLRYPEYVRVQTLGMSL